MKRYENSCYNTVNNVAVSITTAIYNAADTLQRALDSVKEQTYKNIEHIIVDDGSTDDVDSIVLLYLNSAEYPVLYIKKQNGGKYTAMNIIFDEARGKYQIGLDADDELTSDAIEKMVNIWNKIENKDKYWCVLCRCENPKTKKMRGKPFEKNINELSKNDRLKAMGSIKAEMLGMRYSKYLKKYKFPENSEINLIPESYIWGIMNKNYDTYCSNDIVRKYYTDSEVSLSRPRLNEQTIKNRFYSSCLMLNTRKERYMTYKRFLKYHYTYSVYRNLVPKEFKIGGVQIK